jgi:hypothetical protein
VRARAAVLVAIAGGCFRPTPPLGDPCGPNDYCPPPLSCIASVCTLPGGADAAAPAPNVTAAPGPAPLLSSMFQWCNAYPVDVPLELAADDPSATIYYTTDGSVPTTSSPHGSSPLAVVPTATSYTVSYFAATAGATSAIASDSYQVATSCQSTWGFVVSNVKLGAGKTVIVDAMPGEMIAASATVQVWSNGCVGCGVQLVYGIDPTHQGCVYDAAGAAYPGTTQPASFTVVAPTTPGTYDVLVRLVFDTDCTMARNDAASGTWAPRKERIGVVVVK